MTAMGKTISVDGIPNVFSPTTRGRGVQGSVARRGSVAGRGIFVPLVPLVPLTDQRPLERSSPGRFFEGPEETERLR